MSQDTLLYEGKYLNLCERDGWEFVRRQHGVVMLVAVTPDDELLLVEQPRKPLGGRVLELPAGLVGDEGDDDEDPAVAAGRELEEETGFRASTLTPLLEFPTSPGMASESVRLFLATDLAKVGTGGGVENENITVHQVARSQLAAWLQTQQRDGLIIDIRIYAAMALLDLPAAERPQGSRGG